MSDLPADFDPDEYLQLHNDVAAAGLDAGYHYLTYGRSEGRPYKVHADPSFIGTMETMVVTKAPLFRQRLGKETLLVTGAARGATSLVAYVLLRLGYPLVSDQPINHEIGAMIDAVDRPNDIQSIIAAENQRHSRWGFKFPAAALSLDWYVQQLRDPVVMVVSRNPLATARSVQKHEPSWDKGERGLFRAMEHALKYLNACGAAIRCPAPTIFVDVDLVQRKPQVFIRELASLFELPQDAGVADEIAAPGYKAIKESTSR